MQTIFSACYQSGLQAEGNKQNWPLLLIRVSDLKPEKYSEIYVELLQTFNHIVQLCHFHLPFLLLNLVSNVQQLNQVRNKHLCFFSVQESTFGKPNLYSFPRW